MGFEYRAELGGSLPLNTASQLVSLFSSHPDYVVLRVEDNRIALRFAATKPRPHWPEDLQIDVDKTGIYVLFHSGTEPERERLLSLICATLAARNLKCEFEEL